MPVGVAHENCVFCRHSGASGWGAFTKIKNDPKVVYYFWQGVSCNSRTNEIKDLLQFGNTIAKVKNYQKYIDNEKKGKLIKTCVLFVDIRNSVELTKKHQHETMGCIYTAFTKAVLSIAKEHNASVRNIIGDRVMVVFPENNCFTNAIDCAITINHAATIIRDVFANVNFHCGIGIDYGDMRVLKVGIERKGDENQENKNSN